MQRTHDAVAALGSARHIRAPYSLLPHACGRPRRPAARLGCRSARRTSGEGHVRRGETQANPACGGKCCLRAAQSHPLRHGRGGVRVRRVRAVSIDVIVRQVEGGASAPSAVRTSPSSAQVHGLRRVRLTRRTWLLPQTGCGVRGSVATPRAVRSAPGQPPQTLPPRAPSPPPS